MSIRLYAAIRFDRPIRKDTDLISPGGYELVFAQEGTAPLSLRFDFCDTEAWIDENDPCLLHYRQRELDLVSFPETVCLDGFMLHNIKSVDEWYVDTDTNDDSGPLYPTELVYASFVNGFGWEIPLNDSLIRDIYKDGGDCNA